MYPYFSSAILLAAFLSPDFMPSGLKWSCQSLGGMNTILRVWNTCCSILSIILPCSLYTSRTVLEIRRLKGKSSMRTISANLELATREFTQEASELPQECHSLVTLPWASIKQAAENLEAKSTARIIRYLDRPEESRSPQHLKCLKQ